MNEIWRLATADRLKRADEHLKTVKEMLVRYYNAGGYSLRGHYDPNAGEMPITRRAEFPDIRLSTIVGELVHDLRSTLDHLAWQLVDENGGNPDEDTYWPILKTPPKTEAKGVGAASKVSGGVSSEAATLIERHQPYWPGLDPDTAEHQPLHLLHRLSIHDKHPHIPVHGFRFGNISFASGAEIPAFDWTARFAGADECGAELDLVPVCKAA